MGSGGRGGASVFRCRSPGRRRAVAVLRPPLAGRRRPALPRTPATARPDRDAPSGRHWSFNMSGRHAPAPCSRPPAPAPTGIPAGDPGCPPGDSNSGMARVRDPASQPAAIRRGAAHPRARGRRSGPALGAHRRSRRRPGSALGRARGWVGRRIGPASGRCGVPGRRGPTPVRLARPACVGFARPHARGSGARRVGRGRATRA